MTEHRCTKQGLLEVVPLAVKPHGKDALQMDLVCREEDFLSNEVKMKV